MGRSVLPTDRESRILQWIHEVLIDLLIEKQQRLIEKQQRRANEGLTPTDQVRAVMRDVLDSWIHRAVYASSSNTIVSVALP
jgi:hypothetical protein